MPPGPPTIHDDIIEAVIEDEIESLIAAARERQREWGEADGTWSS